MREKVLLSNFHTIVLRQSTIRNKTFKNDLGNCHVLHIKFQDALFIDVCVMLIFAKALSI